MILELKIDRLSLLGEGVAPYEGRSVFVDGVLPGERIRARVEAKGKVLRGELLEVLEPSADRVQPDCPIAEACGGCGWLHVGLEAQRRAKLEILLSALERNGGFDRHALDVRAPVVSPKSLGYRRRAVLHLVGGALSYFGRKSHQSIPVERCAALAPPLDTLPPRLSPHLARIGSDVDEVHVLTDAGEIAFAVRLKGAIKGRHVQACERAVQAIQAAGAVVVPREGAPRLIGDPTLRVLYPLRPEVPLYLRPDVFSQANVEANWALVASAVDELGPADADRVLELYSGNGNFGLAVAGACGELWCVESSNAAVELARRSTREAELKNLHFITGDAGKVCEGLIAEGATFDRILLDPPRAGAPGVARWAERLRARRVTYVACDPASLGRDARALVQAGYRPRAVQWVDMFPQTRHIETVMSFDRG